jgi:hypothetical protein
MFIKSYSIFPLEYAERNTHSFNGIYMNINFILILRKIKIKGIICSFLL